MADPADYRPALPTYHWAPAVRRLEARTSWNSDAAWFGYTCNYKSVDHQNDICGAFHYYRKGEWITKTRGGYSNTGMIHSPDYWNAIAVQNDPISVGWSRSRSTEAGLYGLTRAIPSGVASVALDYAYAHADSTNLYQSGQPAAHDVALVSRSIIWLKPDVIVTYDRATDQDRRPVQALQPRPAHGEPDPLRRQRQGDHPEGSAASGRCAAPDRRDYYQAGVGIGQPARRARDDAVADRIDPSGTVPLDVRFLTVLQTTDGADPGAPALIR